MDRVRRRAQPLLTTMLAIMLTGCAAAEPLSADPTTASPRPSKSASPTALPTPTHSDSPTRSLEPATPTAEADPELGDIISAARLEELLGQGWGSHGTYRLDDDHFVVTDPVLPLPQTVTDDINRRLVEIGADDPNDNGSSASANFDAERVLLGDIAQTGKNAVTLRLRRMAVPNPDGTTGGFRWVPSASQYGWWMQWDTDRDALQADVQSWINVNTTPGTWVVFTGPGERVAPE